MTWWAWVGVWLLLIAGALGAFFIVLRSLWRKGMALLTELGTTSERLSVLDTELASLRERATVPAEPAVFADPARLRQERAAARSGRSGRRTSAGERSGPPTPGGPRHRADAAATGPG